MNDRGQVIILLAICLTVLLMFLALSVDVGFAYVTRAKLSKAVDAACLAAMKNLSQGQAAARSVAQNTFAANYPTSGLDVSVPVPDITFTTDAFGQTVVNVSATATIRTFFMRLIPKYKTFSVSNSAGATRGKLVMSLVLDRSGSMNNNGGSTALPPAVTMFINYFDNAADEVAMVSYASNASVDVAINYNFKTPITNAVNAMKFAGGTFGPGGLTLAKAQNDSVTMLPGQNVVKVVVFFTDGYMNEIQDTFNCPAAKLINYGGYDSGSSVDFFDPTNGTDWGGVSTKTDGSKGALPYDSTPHWCQSSPNVYVTKFLSQSTGQQTTFSRTAVSADAEYRALQTATAMRTEDPAMYVYAIGLGSNVDQAFLKQIANDPGSPAYNSSQPEGMAVFADKCPSSQCTAQLQQVFQTIAARILLRLAR